MDAKSSLTASSILVTGGTGFIGRQLVPALSANVVHLRVAVRNSQQTEQLLTQWGTVEADYVGEIGPDTNWSQALAGIDCVIHLAGRAHMLKETAIDPAAAFDWVNCAGTLNLARQAMAAGVKQFIFVSSIGAMGTLSQDCLTEVSPCYPDTDYGRSKYAAELALIQLCQGTSMTYTILRPTLVYGPGNPGNMERLIKLIRSRLPLPLAALPNKRSFVYVGNLVAAIQACIGHNGAANQLFLISDGEDFSTPGLMRQLGKALGCTVWLWPCPIWVLRWLGRLTGQQATIERLTGSLVVDSSRIRQVLGWHPPFRAAQGLAATATWVREQHKK